jgi:hypothetical protein
MISFSRMSAIFTLSVLFTLIIAIAILGTQSIGTQITHGDMVEHVHGIILPPDDNRLKFQTDSGKIMYFICSERCLAERAHIVRHIQEHAPTDVYYQLGDNTPNAVDVD